MTKTRLTEDNFTAIEDADDLVFERDNVNLTLTLALFNDDSICARAIPEVVLFLVHRII